MKICVIGYSGSGKSTLSKQLSVHYNIPLLYLDTVEFESNWKERDKDEAKAIVRKFMENESWVIDGNYRGYYQTERLSVCDRIILMDFNRFTCLKRVINRYRTNRNKTRESITDGCIEKLDSEFIWWILYKGRTKAVRKHYSDIVSEYKDKCTVIRNQKELDRYIKNNNI